MKKYAIVSDIDFVEGYFEDGSEDQALVYGILYHSTKKEEVKDMYIYNLVASLVLSKKNAVLSSAKIKHWKRLLENIISKLKSYGNDTMVTVPFCNNMYGYGIYEVEFNYELAYDILTEMERVGADKIELIDEVKDAYPVPSMNDMFWNLVADLDTTDFETAEWVPAVQDEMIRRHLRDSVELKKSPDFSRNLYNLYVYESEEEARLHEENLNKNAEA